MKCNYLLLYCLLIRGTASDVLGMVSDTVFRNTVRDNNTVTSEIRQIWDYFLDHHLFFLVGKGFTNRILRIQTFFYQVSNKRSSLQMALHIYIDMVLTCSAIPILPSVNFSPESGGSVKPSSAMLEMRTQGTIRLKK